MISHHPFAESMRPRDLDSVFGHESLLDHGKPLQRLIASGRFQALILWGPPGTGKTTLARIIGASSTLEFVAMSAVEDGVKQIREQINRSKIRMNHGESGLLVFMDEVHRLNKAQQDVLLPALEEGSIRFIGATTENPSFSVNSAVLSRCLVFPLKSLGTTALEAIIRASLSTPKSPHFGRTMENPLIDHIARISDGDARQALTLVDLILTSFSGEKTEVGLDEALPLLPELMQKYSPTGDDKYDLISALIKSIRASKVDAAVYYLARMVEVGEDPKYLARRLVISASEDIGNASPTALIMANSCLQSVAQIGYPEARIILSQTVCYLASCPKSNRSYLAISEAQKAVKQWGSVGVPLHLRNAPTQLLKDLGHGQNYIYAHDRPDEAKAQEYLPEDLKGLEFYHPSDKGAEPGLAKNLAHFGGKKNLT